MDLMNLYQVKFKDRSDIAYEYVAANSMKDVIEALISSMPADDRDEWSLEDLSSIKLIDRKIQIISN